VKEPGAWHCNCRKPLGPYQLNHPHLRRCPVCGVARHHDPTAVNAHLPHDRPRSDEADKTSPQR
jgi:hypothetical protein